MQSFQNVETKMLAYFLSRRNRFLVYNSFHVRKVQFLISSGKWVMQNALHPHCTMSVSLFIAFSGGCANIFFPYERRRNVIAVFFSVFEYFLWRSFLPNFWVISTLLSMLHSILVLVFLSFPPICGVFTMVDHVNKLLGAWVRVSLFIILAIYGFFAKGDHADIHVCKLAGLRVRAVPMISSLHIPAHTGDFCHGWPHGHLRGQLSWAMFY